MIITGPPYEEENDKELGSAVKAFNARELEVEIEYSLVFEDPELPPVSHMEGIDLVTEGILTITKATRIFKEFSPSFTPGKGPADRIVKLVQKSDEIHFIIGTRVNIAHQDPNLTIELEIRRTVVKRMARLLKKNFLKRSLSGIFELI